ncbi:MAG: CRISPR-associated protein Cas4 [Chitinophagales bacterium]|nr:CRISPR-associated protein Cas4 [Chitinophagales bacterium]
MNITATYINYYHLCHRKLWLHANGIIMEHTSDVVLEGKLIGETTYPFRPEKYTELQIGSIKIDFYDAKEKVVHEIKKSSKMEHAHIAQVKYYLFILQKHGIEGATGILEYPKQRHTEKVVLEPKDIEEIAAWEEDISSIVQSTQCPPVIRLKRCQQCSYYDFCYSDEQI